MQYFHRSILAIRTLHDALLDFTCHCDGPELVQKQKQTRLNAVELGSVDGVRLERQHNRSSPLGCNVVASVFVIVKLIEGPNVILIQPMREQHVLPVRLSLVIFEAERVATRTNCRLIRDAEDRLESNALLPDVTTSSTALCTSTDVAQGAHVGFSKSNLVVLDHHSRG